MAILVTGSTGTIGSQVLTHLQGHDVEVRALTRSPEKARVSSGVTPVRGDLADLKDSVRAALDGVSTLFLLAPNVADELTQAMLALAVGRSRYMETQVQQLHRGCLSCCGALCRCRPPRS